MDSQRRSFNKHLGFSALSIGAIPLLGISGCATTQPTITATQPIAPQPTTIAQRPLIKPPRLKKGDTVGLIAPSGYADDGMIEKSVKNIESLGLRVKASANLRARHGGYAGTRNLRAADMHAMFLDPQVSAIWTVRGGSGGAALLPLLDYELIRKNAKILVGFSDITALHLAIQRRSRIVTFHGPAGVSTFSGYSAAHLRAVLMEPQANYTMSIAPEHRAKAAKDALYRARRVNQTGALIAEGILTGGNLSVFAALIGTPYAAQYENALLFLEDVGEAPYRIDRMLAQLDQSAAFATAAGIILGIFERAGATNNDPTLTLDQIADEHFGALKIPTISGFSFGHIAQQCTLPMGVRARLDADLQTLTLLEPAVS
jgi:muramoyltetrapeptide carboxypeptidase